MGGGGGFPASMMMSNPSATSMFPNSSENSFQLTEMNPISIPAIPMSGSGTRPILKWNGKKTDVRMCACCAELVYLFSARCFLDLFIQLLTADSLDVQLTENQWNFFSLSFWFFSLWRRLICIFFLFGVQSFLFVLFCFSSLSHSLTLCTHSLHVFVFDEQWNSVISRLVTSSASCWATGDFQLEKKEHRRSLFNSTNLIS